MRYDNIDFEDFVVQKTIREFPSIIETILARIFEDIIEGNTKEKVSKIFGDNLSTNINFIPSDQKRGCYPLLVAICYDKDNFEERLHACLDHAAITCVGVNQEVFFISTQWNSSIVNRYIGYIESMRRNGVIINLIYFAKKGIALMPV